MRSRWRPRAIWVRQQSSQEEEEDADMRDLVQSAARLQSEIRTRGADQICSVRKVVVCALSGKGVPYCESNAGHLFTVSA